MQKRKKQSAIGDRLAEAANFAGQTEYPSVFAAAYVFLKIRERGLVDVENLVDFVEELDLPQPSKSFLKITLAKTWKSYRPLITAATIDDLRSFIASPKFDMRRYQLMTPHSVIQLCIGALGLGKAQTCADMGSDMGAFLLEAAKNCAGLKAKGFEISAESSIIANLRFDALGLIGRIESIEKDIFALGKDSGRFDRIFCHPPFGLKYLSESGRKFIEGIPSLPPLKASTSSEWYFVLRALASLNDKGRCAVLITSGATFSISDILVRKYLVERNLVEAVVALPAGMMSGTGVQMALVLLNKAKQDASTIMVDASSLGHRAKRITVLSNDEICEILSILKREPSSDISQIPHAVTDAHKIEHEDFILMPKRYAGCEHLNIPNGRPFGELMSAISSGEALHPDERDEIKSSEPTKFGYITQAVIKDGQIDKSEIWISRTPQGKHPVRVLNGDLILTKVGRPLKCTVVDANDDEHLFVGPNLYTIRLNTDLIDPYFVKAYLESPTGQALLSRISCGVGMPVIPMRDLKEITIPVPPMSKQKAVSNLYKARLSEVSYLRREIERASNALNTVYADAMKEA